MAKESEGSGSWWTTLPGVLTATAAIITAFSGLVAILVQNGVIGQKGKDAIRDPVAAVSNVIAPATAPVAVASKVTTEPPQAAESPAPPAPPAAQGVATGVSDNPLPRTPFTGVMITTSDGNVVKLRDNIREYCQSNAVLKTAQGQLINMDLIRRFDVVRWQSQAGTVKIVLNNGDSFTAAIEACSMRGNNDLGEADVEFDTIRSVEFVR